MFASEYGWSIEYINALPADVVPQLVHAILWRRGVQTIFSRPEKDDDAPSLRARLDAMKAHFDTSEEVET